MIETIAAFFAGIFISHWFIWPVLLFSIFFDYKEFRGWAVFFAILAGLGAYLLFKPSLFWLGWGAVAYFPIGFMWSFLRYRRHIGKKVKAFNIRTKELLVEKTVHDERAADHGGNYGKFDLEDKVNTERAYLDRTSTVSHNVDRIIYWVVLWPVSVVQSILDDVIAAIEHFVTKTLRKLYDGIRASAFKNIEEIEALPVSRMDED